MVLGTSEVESTYNTYIENPTEENLQGFIRSRPRDHNEAIEKKVYLEMIQDSRLSWDKRLEKRLFETKNRILVQLCQDNFINHLSGNKKAQLVSKLVTHFQEKSGEWELTYSNSNKKYEILGNQDGDQTDQTETDQTERLIPNGSDRSNSDGSNKMFDHQDNNNDLTQRKGIRIPISLVSIWNPQHIRDYIDSEEYGSNKMFDLPSDLLHEETKSMTIWLTDSQFKKWDAKKIKGFLISKYTQPGRPIHPKIKNRELQSEVDNLNGFKESFKNLAKMFNHFFKTNPEFKGEVKNYRKLHKIAFEQVQESIKKLKGGT